MEKFSEKELLAIALTLKDKQVFPSQELFSLEVKYGIAFNQLDEKDEVDEVGLEERISLLRENEPAEFEKLYLAMEKFWDVVVVNLQERLKELKLKRDYLPKQ
ncbi:MAG: hypothetical protein PUP92_08850 [Rhizonema sp. PD38]|nr:hypothetical protein [Rhizonema sp. PD38]